eukprot:3444603-Karenia_brevis.AAC.1
MTQRGGWQGSRLVMVMFCFSLEESFARVPMLRPGGGVVRTGYQDDTYMIGKASLQLQQWPDLTAALAAEGHRLRPHK